MKIPEFPLSSRERKKIYILQELPPPLTRADEHWQIFDDYTAWPEYRLRQVRVPQTREWFRYKEEISVEGSLEKISRELVPDDSQGPGPHPDEEIRKNRYFYEYEGREFAIDVFLGKLWGLIIAQVTVSDEDAGSFSSPEFAAFDVSDNEFFRGENLVHSTFEEIRTALSKGNE
jgi:CYTH domain-containing protein